MSAKDDKWRILPLFKVAVIAAIFTSTLSHITSVKAQETLEPTIETRLAKIRERLKQIRQESDILLSLENSMEINTDEIIQSQWPNYWSNWSDGWNDWSNWSNWSDAPWSNWSDWSDWSNWSNYYY